MRALVSLQNSKKIAGQEIRQGYNQWTLMRNFTPGEIFTERFVKNVHKRMYGNVWRWALRKMVEKCNFAYSLIPRLTFWRNLHILVNACHVAN